MTGPLTDVTMQTLIKAMDGYATRQRVIANNVANVDTPGFTASRVDFESSLSQALAGGDPNAAAIATTKSTDTAGPNGNNVNLATETLSLNKADLGYQTMIEGLNAKFQLLRTAITG